MAKESVYTLQTMIRSESNSKNVLRLQSLIHIKEKRFSTRSALSRHLGYNIRTMELWLKEYRESGLQAMLILANTKQVRKRLVSQEVKEGLSKRLHNPEQGFSSYVSACQWVEKEYGVTYNYHTLRQYMIDVFGTKLKQPRKSHIKKDPEAQADFLKLT